MNGFNLSEAGHLVLALAPQTISGGATAQAFHMKEAEHVSIVVAFGQIAGSPVTNPTAIVLKQCTDANGSNATAITSFRYYYQTVKGAGHDILDGYGACLSNSPNLPPNYTTGGTGITVLPTDCTNLIFVIEVDAAELESIADAVGPQTEYPYLQVVITNGANASYCAILAVLSGLRHAYKVGLTATT